MPPKFCTLCCAGVKQWPRTDSISDVPTAEQVLYLLKMCVCVRFIAEIASYLICVSTTHCEHCEQLARIMMQKANAQMWLLTGFNGFHVISTCFLSFIENFSPTSCLCHGIYLYVVRCIGLCALCRKLSVSFYSFSRQHQETRH